MLLKFSEIPNPKFLLYLCSPGPGHRTTEERPGARQPGPQDAVAHLPSSIPKRCHASNLPPHSFPCYLWSLDLTLRVFRCVTGAHPVPEADLVVPPRWRGHRRRRDPRALKSLHHKAELVVVISWRGRDVPEASAMDFIRGNLRIVSQRWSLCHICLCSMFSLKC